MHVHTSLRARTLYHASCSKKQRNLMLLNQGCIFINKVTKRGYKRRLVHVSVAAWRHGHVEELARTRRKAGLLGHCRGLLWLLFSTGGDNRGVRCACRRASHGGEGARHHPGVRVGLGASEKATSHAGLVPRCWCRFLLGCNAGPRFEGDEMGPFLGLLLAAIME